MAAAWRSVAQSDNKQKALTNDSAARILIDVLVHSQKCLRRLQIFVLADIVKDSKIRDKS